MRGSLIVPVNLESHIVTKTYVVSHALMFELQKATQDKLTSVMEGSNAKGTVAPKHPKDSKFEKLPYKVCVV